MNLRSSIEKSVAGSLAILSLLLVAGVRQVIAQNQKPNIVMLMTDDTGWNVRRDLRYNSPARTNW
jgi:hypothetical protein